MFCEKCGTALEDGAAFCSNCGEAFGSVVVAPVAPAEPVVDNGYDAGADYNVGADAAAKTPNNKNKIIAIAAAAVVVIVAVVLVLVLCTGGAKKTLNKYLDIRYNAEGSVKSFVSYMYPDEILEERLEDMDMTEDEYIVELEESLEEYKEEMEDEGISYKFEILNEKDMKAKDLRDYNEELEDYGIEASKGKVFKVKVIEYIDGDKEDSNTIEVELVKIGGSWYIA